MAIDQKDNCLRIHFKHPTVREVQHVSPRDLSQQGAIQRCCHGHARMQRHVGGPDQVKLKKATKLCPWTLSWFINPLYRYTLDIIYYIIYIYINLSLIVPFKKHPPEFFLVFDEATARPPNWSPPAAWPSRRPCRWPPRRAPPPWAQWAPWAPWVPAQCRCQRGCWHTWKNGDTDRWVMILYIYIHIYIVC